MGKADETLGDLHRGRRSATAARRACAHSSPTPPSARRVAARQGDDPDRLRPRRAIRRDRPQPPFAATLARETHVPDLGAGQQTQIQIGFAYSDGFGREIQKKIQAEPGDAPRRQAPVRRSGRQPRRARARRCGRGRPGQYADAGSAPAGPSSTTRASRSGSTSRSSARRTVRVRTELTAPASARCCSTTRSGGSSRRCTPTTRTRRSSSIRGARRPGTSTTRSLHVARDRRSAHGSGRRRLRRAATSRPSPPAWQTWYAAAHRRRSWGRRAATPRPRPQPTRTRRPSTHLDTLGRPFLTVAHNRLRARRRVVEEHSPPGSSSTSRATSARSATATDAAGALEQRVVMRYDYDLLGNRIHQASMEAGERWMLNDVAGKPIRAWDSRAHSVPHDLRRAAPARRACTSRTTAASSDWSCEHRVRRGQSATCATSAAASIRPSTTPAIVTSVEPTTSRATCSRAGATCVPTIGQPTDWLAEPACDRRNLHEPHDATTRSTAS